jgi:hypothetical protein
MLCSVYQPSNFRYIESISVQKKPAISNEINSKLEGFKAEVYFNTSASVALILLRLQ